MKTAANLLLLFAIIAWAVLVARPAGQRYFTKRLEFLQSEQGIEHIESHIRTRILDRYGSKALADYLAGEAFFPSIERDLIRSELFLPSLAVLSGALFAGWGLLGWAWWAIADRLDKSVGIEPRRLPSERA